VKKTPNLPELFYLTQIFAEGTGRDWKGLEGTGRDWKGLEGTGRDWK
jgi:hypothetical protein